MLMTLGALWLVSQVWIVLWVKRTIRQNEDRCEAKRRLHDRMVCFGEA